jgi:phosphoglucomutase
MMAGFRNNPPKKLAGSEVVQLLDYELKKGKNLSAGSGGKTGEEWQIKLPKSNVLQFILADGSKISARPSGTEPKIKFYFSIKTKLNTAAEFDKTNAALDEKIKAIISDMKL